MLTLHLFLLFVSLPLLTATTFGHVLDYAPSLALLSLPLHDQAAIGPGFITLQNTDNKHLHEVATATCEKISHLLDPSSSVFPTNVYMSAAEATIHPSSCEQLIQSMLHARLDRLVWDSTGILSNWHWHTPKEPRSQDTLFSTGMLHQIWLGPAPLPRHLQDHHARWRSTWSGGGVVLWTRSELESSGIVLPSFVDGLGPAASDPRLHSDIYRLQLLYKYGGWYADLDTVPLRSMPQSLISLSDGKVVLALEDPSTASNAFMGAAPGNTFIGRILSSIESWARLHAGRRTFEVTGPKLLTRAARDFPDEVKLLPPSFAHAQHFSATARHNMKTSEAHEAQYLVHQFASHDQFLPLQFEMTFHRCQCLEGQPRMFFRLTLRPWLGVRLSVHRHPWSACVQEVRPDSRGICQALPTPGDKDWTVMLSLFAEDVTSLTEDPGLSFRGWLRDPSRVPDPRLSKYVVLKGTRFSCCAL